MFNKTDRCAIKSHTSIVQKVRDIQRPIKEEL